MKTDQSHWGTIRRHFAWAGMALPLLAYGVDTNWVAYNDHQRGGATAAGVGTYTITTTAGATVGGPLTNFLGGQILTAGVAITPLGGSLNGNAGSSTAPNTGSPADLIFGGKVDFTGSAYYFATPSDRSAVTITFTNLDSAKKYIFRGTAVRGNSYAQRWTLVTLAGADSAVPAHIEGTGSPGLVTNGYAPYGNNLAAGTQVAFNSGENRPGDVVGWDEIVPTGGSFSVISSNFYEGTLPPSGLAVNNYCYAINAFMLVEVEAFTLPVAIVQEPVGTNVIEFRPFSLSVLVTGSRPQFQWYKGETAIVGANSATYAVAQAQVDQTGDYHCVVSNSSNSVASATVHVEVLEDTAAPTVVQAVGSATFNQVSVQFNEILDPASLTDTANFTLDPGSFSPISILLTNGGTVVVLTFADLQTPDTDYTLSMNYVTDLAQNSIPELTPATFHSWVPNPIGGVVFQVFPGLSTSDNAIGQLTNNANFPYKPAETYILNGLNTREAYVDDSHEGYGGRLWTLFVPLATGKYRFFTYSDDSSYIYLNPAGPDPAGRTLVAYEPSCCNPFSEPGTTRTSDPIDLVAGHGYYIEAIYKEGTGGDYCYVGARLEGDPTPASALTNIMSSAAAAPALPKGLVGPVVISTQPANVTVEQPALATFSVVAGSAPAGPLLYQWQKSDDAGGTWADIPGAAGPSYTTGPTVKADDDQDLYRVVVKSPGGEATSDAATLTVDPDITGPTVVSAVRAPDLSTILITFSEPIDATLGTDPTLYSVCNTYNSGECLDILSGIVELTNNNTQAYLVTSVANPGTIYRVTVLSDMADTNMNRIQYPDYAIVGVSSSFQEGDANGYAGTADAHVRSDEATTAHDLAILLVDNLSPLSHGLLRFDNIFGANSGQVPAGSVISSATLRLYTLNWGNPIRIHRMLVPWTEASTWNDVGSANDGVSLTAGDAVATAELTFTTAAVDGGINEWREVDVTPSVRFWATNGGPNYGWALFDSGDDGYQGSSSEATDQTLRPQLVIHYTASAETNPVVIVTQPASTNIINEGENITLSVVVTGTKPSYQWYKDDAEIPGATGPSHAITAAVTANSGKYYCRISNLANAVQSGDSWLTVVPDLTRPTVLSAKGGPATNVTVLVTFSEPVAQASAEDAANYELLGPGGITVVSAVLSGNSAVTLTLSGPRTAGENYSVTVKDVVDRAAAANAIDPNPTIVPLATVVELIAINTQPWKYLQQTVWGEPAPCLDGVGWTAPGHGDSAWQSGFGVFYGNRDSANQPATLDGSAVNTYLNVFTNTAVANELQEYTYYFRTKFSFPGLTNEASLLLHSMVDDGVVIYLNGSRVYELRVTNNPASCTNFTAAAATGGQTWVPALAAVGTAISLDGLQTGPNTLAVELHQNNNTSSDVTLGILLEAEVLMHLPRLHYVYDAVAQTLTLSWGSAGFTLEEATEVTGPWTRIATTSPQSVSTATGTKFYRLLQTP